MPTERFYRLPKEKSEAIRQAAIREFKRVSPDEASINRIIQDAEISRGSFYTYFADKQDLLKWLLLEGTKNFQRFYVTELLKTGGDIWDVFDRVLDDTIRWLAEKGFIEIMGNIMKSNFSSEYFRREIDEDPKKGGKKKGFTDWLYRHMDKALCPISEEDFPELINLQILSLVLALKMVFQDHMPMDRVCELYRKRMRILKYGVCPGPEKSELEESKGRQEEEKI